MEPKQPSDGPKTDAAPLRRPYQKPRLSRFGSLAEITQSVDNMGGMDGGPTVGMRRT